MSMSQRRIVRVPRRNSTQAPSLILNPKETFEPQLALKVAQKKQAVSSNSDVEIGKDKEGNSVTVSRWIGGGSHGEVFLALWKNEYIALKQIDVKKTMPSRVHSEIAMMQKLTKEKAGDDNVVVCYFSSALAADYAYVGMEIMNKGSMCDFIASGFPRRWMVSDAVIKGCARAINFMHQKGILHGDIKSENVLINISENNYFSAKIADFGHSITVKEATERGTRAGTALWMAPELLSRSGTNSKASDMFSFGIVVWESITWTNSEPYSHEIPKIEDDYDKLKIVVCDAAKEKTRQPIPEDTPPHIKEIMIGCWCHDPSNRKSISQVLPMLFRPPAVVPKSKELEEASFKPHC